MMSSSSLSTIGLGKSVLLEVGISCLLIFGNIKKTKTRTSVITKRMIDETNDIKETSNCLFLRL
jgi:hypothetical protein